MLRYPSTRRRPLHLGQSPTAASSFSTSLSPYSFPPLSQCKDLCSVFRLHAHLIVSGCSQDRASLTHLINTYSLHQRCDLSFSVFSSSRNPAVILWNSMIRAYTRSNLHEKSLSLYQSMLREGLEPDKFTFTFVLKACTGARNLQEGLLVHKEVARRGFESDVFIGAGLVHMYCKAGKFNIARQLFDRMPQRDSGVWNAMIAGASQGSDPSEALRLFRSMQLTGVVPNFVSLLNLFPAISRLGDVNSCRCIHGYVTRIDFGKEISNGLIDTYSKCGDVGSARRVFDLILGHDIVSFATMMSSYSYNGLFSEVLALYETMKMANIGMNKVTIVSASLAVGESGDLEMGKEIYQYAVEQGFNSDVAVATSLMTMYAKCGEIDIAEKLFEELVERDLVAWSALIAAFVQSGYPEKALIRFQDMQRENVKPNRITLIGILPACAELSLLAHGQSIHCYLLKGDMDGETTTGTALVSMYSKCRKFSHAITIFSRTSCKDVATWNALINGFTQNGDSFSAIKMFQELWATGVCPDERTLVGLIPAVALSNNQTHGTCVHCLTIKSGFESDCHIRNALIDMYFKYESLPSALCLFNGSEANFTKNVVSWNVMIAGYFQNGDAKESLWAFHEMRVENVQPNAISFASILPAVAHLASVREGMGLHACVTKLGLELVVKVGNSLIDMYAKCGRIDFSEKFFHAMEHKDTISWNAMLAGYAIHGRGNQAISLFKLMQESHVEIDSLSYVSVLSACRHAGLIEEGREIFHSMHESRIKPNSEHYACMVDLVGRAGLFDEALQLIREMPLRPDAGVWGALLGACRMHSNVKLGEYALNHLVELEPANPAHYVVLSSIYARSGRWVDAGKARLKVSETGLMKTPGCSWVEVKGKVHAFMVNDPSHPQIESMQLLWNDLLEKMGKLGYVPDRSCVLQNVEEEDKEQFLYGHSERLAITFAILNTEHGSTLQIVKNLRVCVDCHTVMKLIAKITGRTIIVRDATRFHHFEGGICSCGDYW
ncbi:hypothetical protein SAY86_027001 [Trapa natans]|uniref:DYW domain-containing protein n=1 Tax=Trapa natans TaxID=22666 RepID=A0AAN7KKE2_TRANT|nr:hypothetical protein SAY86_027001 [Trapa natans]